MEVLFLTYVLALWALAETTCRIRWPKGGRKKGSSQPGSPPQER